MGFDHPLSLLTHDLAIDLGTANTLVYLQGRGIVVDEPSVVAVRQSGQHREVVAIGMEAKRMMGRTPGSIQAVYPLQGGVIDDYELAEAMLRHFIQRAVGRKLLVKPRIAVSIPYGTTEVEKRAVQESARAAGGREVLLLREPLVAALGAELPVMDPHGCLLCDIGSGTTGVAVLSLGGVVTSQTRRVAGRQMDRAIIAWARRRHNVLIGEASAEALKLEVGCARPPEAARTMRVRGRDLTSGIPKEITVTHTDMAEALADTMEQIVDTIRATLSTTPPELAADIMDSGLVLSGGGSLLPGLAEMIRDISGLPVVLAPRPLRCAALGAGLALENPDVMERALL